MKRALFLFLLVLVASTMATACGGGNNSDVSANAHVWNFEVATEDVAVFDPATRTKAVCELRPGEVLPVVADDNGVWTIRSSLFTREYRISCPSGRPAWVRESQGELIPIGD